MYIYLTVFKQITDIKLLLFTAIVETIKLRASKWLMINQRISIWEKYLKLFNSLQNCELKFILKSFQQNVYI